MRRLKIVLLSNYFYGFLTIIITLYVLIFTLLIKYESCFESGYIELSGTVMNLVKNEGSISFVLNSFEKVKVNYYEKNDEIREGMVLKVKGQLDDAKNNTIFNCFNYKKYLYNKRIYKILILDSYEIEKEENIFYKIKNELVKKIEQNNKCSVYLKLFILGNKESLDSNLYNIYKTNGIAHLLAISGMHISLFVLILKKLLYRVNQKTEFIIIFCFLSFYVFLTNFTVSIMRCFIFFILNYFNKKFKLSVSSLKVLYLTGFILLIFNPFYFYDVGFRYSMVITFGIMLYSKNIKGNYFKRALQVSMISLLFSLPISVNLNYEINVMSLLVNLIMVPFVCYIFYPCSLLTLFFPFLSGFYEKLIFLFETANSFFDSMAINLIMPKMNIILTLFYYVFLILFVVKKKRVFLVFLITILIFNKCLPLLNFEYRIIYFDVGQGDSILISNKNRKENILIDTGGKVNSEYKVSLNVILYLKSIGITKLDYLILTHGDYDHLGDAINLVENFKIKNVIFNCGEFNNLENNLIMTLKEKKIPYYSCVKNLKIGDDSVYFLNALNYTNENDNSIVLYANLNNYKFLFMADAGVKVEEDIKKKYYLRNIDVLKVGHHGSKTSSSKEFIDEINPKYSVISVGKNNRYNHPSEEILNVLKKSKIYRTDLDGSVIFKIKKDRLKVETCSP